MLRAYIEAAMERAEFEIIDQPGEPHLGHIPGLDGVYALGATQEQCRAQLEEVLDGWIILGLRLGHKFPDVNGCSLAAYTEAFKQPIG